VKRALAIVTGLLCLWLLSWRPQLAGGRVVARPPVAGIQRFQARGTIQELKADGRSIVIQHRGISNYMNAMTVPFKVKDTNQLRDLVVRDEVQFRLLVAQNESWIDHVTKIKGRANSD
jgi:Cu/Ag efflux protein CusF